MDHSGRKAKSKKARCLSLLVSATPESPNTALLLSVAVSSEMDAALNKKANTTLDHTNNVTGPTNNSKLNGHLKQFTQ